MAYCERCSAKVDVGPHCGPCIDTLRQAAEYDRCVQTRGKPGDADFCPTNDRDRAAHRAARRKLNFGNGHV